MIYFTFKLILYWIYLNYHYFPLQSAIIKSKVISEQMTHSNLKCCNALTNTKDLHDLLSKNAQQISTESDKFLFLLRCTLKQCEKLGTIPLVRGLICWWWWWNLNVPRVHWLRCFPGTNGHQSYMSYLLITNMYYRMQKKMQRQCFYPCSHGILFSVVGVQY